VPWFPTVAAIWKLALGMAVAGGSVTAVTTRSECPADGPSTVSAPSASPQLLLSTFSVTAFAESAQAWTL